jgi:phosphatidylserine/phosphatidylglycerophosphate/cardiolipin synthase-like enzyme
MRALVLSCALLASVAAIAADAPRFLKIDIVDKSGKHTGSSDGPTEVHVRLPLSFAKGILDMAAGQECQINGKHHKAMKVDELSRLLEGARPGDMLLEVNTDKGDVVKIVIE